MTPELKRRLTLAACGGAHGVQDGLSGTLYVVLPILAEAFGLTYAQVGLVRAAKNLASSLLELPSGLLAERLGEHRLLVFGLLAAGCGYLWLAAASGLRVILASLFVVGVGSAFQHALSSSIISTTFDLQSRRGALGLYNSAGDAGKLVFTGLFSFSIGVGVAWQSVIAAFGACALILAVGVHLILRTVGAGQPRARSVQASDPEERIGWGIADKKGFAALCLAVFLNTAVQSGFLVFLAFLIAEKDVPTNLAVFAVVLTLFGGIFGKAGCGYLAERLGARQSFAVVQCATAIGIVALLQAPPLIAFAMLPVLGIFLQGSSSITYGSVGDFIHRDRQSRGFAIMYSVGNVSAVGGPVAFGVLGDHSGLTSAMIAMALLTLVAILPGLLLRATATRL